MNHDATDMEFLTRMDDGSCALVSTFDFTIRHARLDRHDFSRSDMYQEIAAEEVLLGTAAPARACVDGGSMTTTTRRKEILWYMRAVSDPPALKVGDNIRHYPEV